MYTVCSQKHSQKTGTLARTNKPARIHHCHAESICSYPCFLTGLDQWFPTFLTLPPFNTVPPVVATPTITLFSRLFHNGNYVTAINITYLMWCGRSEVWRLWQPYSTPKATLTHGWERLVRMIIKTHHPSTSQRAIYWPKIFVSSLFIPFSASTSFVTFSDSGVSASHGMASTQSAASRMFSFDDVRFFFPYLFGNWQPL